MRNPEKIIEAGRSDPNSVMEKRQHPYDFVSFGVTLQLNSPCFRHDHYEGKTYSGTAVFRMFVLSPVHIGSGIYELSEDVGFLPGNVVRGIVTKNGRPIVPGTSIKGAVRSHYEAITTSCVCIHKSKSKESFNRSVRNKSKVPRELISGLESEKGKISVELKDKLDVCGEIKSKNGKSPNAISLCPACVLFGSMGYQGRISFSDAEIVSTPLKKGNPLGVTALNSPQLHRAGFNAAVKKEKGKEKIEITELYGRKFYYQSDIDPGPNPKKSDLIDYIPIGTILEFNLSLNNVMKAEIGGLLTALGIQESFIFRIGGGKPIGLGCVRFELHDVRISDDPVKRYNDYMIEASKINITKWIEERKKEFKVWPVGFPDGLNQLSKITMVRRPTHAEAKNSRWR